MSATSIAAHKKLKKMKYFRAVFGRKSDDIAMPHGNLTIDKRACGHAHFARNAHGGFLI
ncbi:hypothetical protein [Sphingobium chlorophenolicum]|uniref:hypothetical protein n=1 Tax=Sphingobium chlorophenolicum TaxID=46429 RepID=UPI0012DD3785|nr:hypothetical protein [Sphingobium chlorophenolicum]